MFIFGPIQRLFYPGLLNPALTGKFLSATGNRTFMIYFPAALGDTAQASKIPLLAQPWNKLDQLKESKLYWHGPEWLILEESCWPAQDVACMLTPESVEEMKNEEVKIKTALTALAAFPTVDISSIKWFFRWCPLEGAREQRRLPREAPESATWGAREW